MSVPTQTRIRIALADDHPVFRDSLCRLLSVEEDFEVVAEAKDGDEVSNILRDEEPDVLLLDVQMPKLNGISVLRLLQSQDYKTKVILLTASDDQDHYVQAMKRGASGIILKQNATEALLEGIRKVHAGEVCLDSKTTAAVMRQFCTSESLSTRKDGSQLSDREREITLLIAQGNRNREIAKKLYISEQTVKNHLHNIFDKVGVSDRLELALYAIENKIQP